MQRHFARALCACVTLVTAIAAAPARAQDADTIGEEDLSWFASSSRAQYGLRDALGLESRLIDAQSAGGDAEAVLARFAASIDANRAQAELYAQTLIAVLRRDHECGVALANCRDCSALRRACEDDSIDMGVLRESSCGPVLANCRDCSVEGRVCQVDSNAELLRTIRRVGLAEPSGGLLVSIGARLYERPLADEVRGIVLDHDERSAILTALADYTGDFIYLAWALAEPNPRAGAFQGALRERFEHAPQDVIAVLRIAHQRAAQVDLDTKASASAALIYQLLRYGMDGEALAVLDDLPAAEQSLLYDPSSAVFANAGGLFGRCMAFPSVGGCAQSRGDASPEQVFIDFGLSLSSALVAAGRRDEAAAIIDVVRTVGVPENTDRRRTVELVAEILRPSLTDGEIFDAFIFGYPHDEPEPSWIADARDNFMIGGGVSGWIVQASGGTPALRVAAASYLRERGHQEMADYVLAPSPYRMYLFADSPRRLPAQLIDRLGSGFGDTLDEAESGLTAASQSYRAHASPEQTPEERLATLRATVEASFGDLAAVAPLPDLADVDWLFSDPSSDALVYADYHDYGGRWVLLEVVNGVIEEEVLSSWMF